MPDYPATIVLVGEAVGGLWLGYVKRREWRGSRFRLAFMTVFPARCFFWYVWPGLVSLGFVPPLPGWF